MKKLYAVLNKLQLVYFNFYQKKIIKSRRKINGFNLPNQSSNWIYPKFN